MKFESWNSPLLSSAVLNFEQRGAAQDLVEDVEGDPLAAAFEIVALRAEVASRNDAMAEALEILDGYGRTNPTLPMACAELMRHHTELRIQHANVERELNQMKAEASKVWKATFGCDCVPESGYTCDACGLRVSADAVVTYIKAVERDQSELFEVMEALDPEWCRREEEGETLCDRIHALKAEVERLRSQLDPESAQHWDAMRMQRDKAYAEVERLREELTPSGATMAAYRNEFSIRTTFMDEDGAEHVVDSYVPWGSIKQIMAAIGKRAALRGEEAPINATATEIKLQVESFDGDVARALAQKEASNG